MKTKPTLNAADLKNIRILLNQECIPLNKAERKKMRALEKELRELKKCTPITNALCGPYIDPNAPVFKFLLGEGDIGGLYFGDHVPAIGTQRAPFWWRKHLREALGLPTKTE